MANPSTNVGNRSGGQAAGVDPDAEPSGGNLDEFDIASDLQGRNQLQGDNQADRINQRQAQAEAKGDTDGLIESFEKMDKDVRAERDLGKGNRSGAGQ
ncbi:MAG: hypothetical protein JWR39_102 [Devosia sp.]|nr:hypothetical protein [Devosia sp.]